MKKKFFLFFILIILALLVACGNANATDDEVPLLWRVTSPSGQTMYLFGSIHVGTPDIYPLPNFIMEAFNRSDYLAVEIDISREPDLGEQMAITMPFMYTDGRTVLDDIGEELYQRANAIFAEHGAQWFGEMFMPIMWWVSLVDLAVELAGWSPEYGVDLYFIETANSRNMQVLELESVVEQTQMLANFSIPLQIALLEDMVEAFENIDELIEYDDDLLRAWIRGDEQWILQMQQEEFDALGTFAGEYEYAMLINRDIHMTQKARDFMAEGKNVFLVVGLLHLIGENSITDLLIQQGYEVERIR